MGLTDKLDLLMKERKINKAELARASGVPYTTIDGFYKKGSENSKLSTLKKLCAYFNCSLDYLADNDIKKAGENMTIQEQMGQRIKRLREELKMSQSTLAELVGYKDKTAIAKVEAGKVDLPQSKISSLAKVLKTNTSYLFGDLDNIDESQTIAAHFDGDEYTEEELEKIKEIAAFVKQSR